VLDLLRRSEVPHLLAMPLRPVGRALDQATRPLGLAEHPLRVDPTRQRAGDAVFWLVVGGLAGWGAWLGLSYLHRTVGLAELGRAVGLGAVTFARVLVLLVWATLVWVPVGAQVGLRPRLARYAQPVVQVLASFPANFLFPFATIVFVKLGLSLNLGGILLMSLGAQWYVLFNAIAGAMAIPTDLREALTSFRVPTWQRWRQLILPGIFPAYVTGAITAAGGAWNASIVAEVVDFGNRHLVATGLGAYIAQATASGDFPRILAGIAVMSAYVVALNRLVWRRLYRLAETRYSL
jgi:NitT/TauT family transport system permease protein